MPHVVITKSSGLPWLLSIQDKSSLKFVGLIFWQALHSEAVHIELSLLHDHSACNVVSSSIMHRSHSAFLVICRRFRFAFVGITLRHAHHTNFFTLYGTLKTQILCQKLLSSTCVSNSLDSSTSLFKKRYPDLQEYFPVCVHGKKNYLLLDILIAELIL